MSNANVDPIIAPMAVTMIAMFSGFVSNELPREYARFAKYDFNQSCKLSLTEVYFVQLASANGVP